MAVTSHVRETVEERELQAEGTACAKAWDGVKEGRPECGEQEGA